jgi:hypothetical protein
MKSFSMFAAIVAVLLSACGSVTPMSRGQGDWIGYAVGADHSADVRNYENAQAVQREERRMAMSHAGCVPGYPCATLTNALPQGMAIFVARVNDKPIDTNPDGGEIPTGFFMPGQRAAFNWARCTERDPFSGDCWYTFSGIATYTVNVNDIAPSSEGGIEYIPTMDPDVMSCFRKRILVSKQMIMNGFNPAIDQNDLNNGQCNFDQVPKTMVMAKKK